jgi:hypothetical protein
VPYLNRYDAGAAATLANNCDMTKEVMMVDSFAALKSALEAAYPALGYTCAQVGGLVDSNMGGYYAGAEPCVDSSTAAATPPTTSPSASSDSDNNSNSNTASGSDNDSNSVSPAAAAAIALAVFIATCGVFTGIFFLARNNNKQLIQGHEVANAIDNSV